MQTIDSNNLGGEEVNTVYYDDYTSRVKRTVQHLDAGGKSTQVTRRFGYDERGRLLNAWHEINNKPVVHIAGNEYNEFNQLIEKNIGNGIQSIDYTYNIRGWLKSINDAALSDGEGDLFGMELSYNTAASGLNNQVQYNGNISGMKWSNYDTKDEGLSELGYAYTYDHADRLKDADHMKHVTSWTTTQGFDVMGTQYDPNGNITHINRNDTDGSTIDDLSYSYVGNKLLEVSDAADSLGFADDASIGDDYAYDVNGNMIKDLNKGIDSIIYNHLDLPITIILDQSPVDPDSLTYSYTATGTKLGMKVWKGGVTTGQIDYLGNFRYEDGALHSIMHEEGRIVLKDNSYDYQYNLRDHQGNTRRVLSTLPENHTMVATMEYGIESEMFNNYAPHQDAVAANSGSHVSVNSNLLNNGLDLNTFLRVDRDDTVKISARAYYNDSRSNYGLLSNSLAGALFSIYGANYGTEGLNVTQSNFDAVFDVGSTLGTKSTNSNAPKAFINYIFFDRERNYKRAGFKQIGSANASIQHVVADDFIAEENGYLMIYLSNETSGDEIIVSWDDFTVYQGKTNVVQSIDYYPFGMEATSYTRTATDSTLYLYNGGVEKNGYTSYYETFYRQYDASIGRFTAVDVAVGKYASQSPYQYAFNDPVSLNDPLGDDPFRDQYREDQLSENWAMTMGYFWDEHTTFAYGGSDNWHLTAVARDAHGGRNGSASAFDPAGRGSVFSNMNSMWTMNGLMSGEMMDYQRDMTNVAFRASVNDFNNGRTDRLSLTSSATSTFYKGTIAKMQNAAATAMISSQVGSGERSLAEAYGQYLKVGSDGRYYLPYTDTEITGLDLLRGNYAYKPSGQTSGGSGRPDDDRYLTFGEAWDWYRNGNGQSLHVDLNKLDLSGIKASDFPKGVGSVKAFNLLGGHRSNTNEGLVYGNVELKLINDNTVEVYRRDSYGLPIDVYDFDMKDWNSRTFKRNVETFGGWVVHGGSGTPFIIWMYGQGKIGK